MKKTTSRIQKLELQPTSKYNKLVIPSLQKT